jgi:hypothetical protein
MFKSFKKFIEEKHPYFSSLEDELGIDINDLQNEPQIGSFFSIGKGNISNLIPYKIIKFKRNNDGKITHAVVKKNSDLMIKSKQYKEKDGKILQVNKEEEKRFIVPIEELDKLISQDFQPPPSAPGMVV